MDRGRTFDQLAAIHLARCDLQRDNVTLYNVSDSARSGIDSGRTAASLRSLMGMPIVLVMLMLTK